MAPVSSMVTGEGASAYAAGSQVWNGNMGTLTANPARTPMASHKLTGPRCAVTICSSSPVDASRVKWPKSMLPVETKMARNATNSATDPAMV